MDLPQVVSREDWLAERRKLLASEKELTRQRDAVNAERRQLSMVEIDKQGDRIFHTYSSYARGGDLLLGTFNYLDLTPLGRQYHVGQAVYHDRYDTSEGDGGEEGESAPTRPR